MSLAFISHLDPLLSDAALCWEASARPILSALGLQTQSPVAPCQGVPGLGFAMFALAAVVVIALGRMRLHTESKRLEVAQRFVERGVEPPAGLLMGPARNDLRKGVVLIFAGIGLFAAGMVAGDRGLAAGALVPKFVGIGYLVSFWLAGRQLGARD
jgi:hypothetical protein